MPPTDPGRFTKLARDLGYGSRNQLDRRIQRLIATFAAIECPQRIERGTRVAGSQSKYYLTDPILAWLPSRMRAGLSEPDLTTLTEMVLGTALAVAVEGVEEGRLAQQDTIGYLRTESGQEIDLGPVSVPTAGGPERTTPLESKWVTRGWRSEARVIEGKFGAGVLATRNIIDLSSPAWAIPAPIVALLIA